MQTMLTMQLGEAKHSGNTHIGMYDVDEVFSLRRLQKAR